MGSSYVATSGGFEVNALVQRGKNPYTGFLYGLSYRDGHYRNGSREYYRGLLLRSGWGWQLQEAGSLGVALALTGGLRGYLNQEEKDGGSAYDRYRSDNGGKSRRLIDTGPFVRL